MVVSLRLVCDDVVVHTCRKDDDKEEVNDLELIGSSNECWPSWMRTEESEREKKKKRS